jgi:preprotein translocase subunit SecF
MNIIKHKKFWLIFSLAMIVVAIPLLIIFKIPAGIDFTGGSQIEIKANQDENVSDVRSKISKFYTTGDLVVQESGQNQFIITTKSLPQDQYNQFQSDLQSAISSDILRHQSIGPSVGQNLTRKAIEGVLVAAALIIMYLAYSFRQVPRSVSSWTFGTVAILTLIHDLAFTTAVFFIIGKFYGYELDSLFVVAALTILGFSTHDTIVVFDRIRENMIKNPQESFSDNANSSINQTLARSLNTSLAAILVLISMLILGGSTLKPFILMLTIGIGIGTYSSIFVASPALVTWFEYQNRKKK